MLQAQLNTIMNEDIADDDINPLKLVKSFYRSCRDMDRINEIGIDHVVEKMKFLGGWPVIKSHNWDEKNWFWQKAVQDIELIGFSSNYVFSFGLIQDLKKTTERILVVKNFKIGAEFRKKVFNLNFRSTNPVWD